MEKTVAKAMKALELLCRAEQPLGITQIARELGLNKSNVHRVLGTFLALGYVRRTENAAYAPSLKLSELGALVWSRNDLGQVAKPYLADLCARTGETVFVTVLDGSDVLYLEKQESAHPVRIAATVGGRLPGYCSASGRVLLAHAPDGEQRLREIEFVRHTPNTIMSVKELRSALRKVREQGFELSVEEYMPDVCGLAVPIRSGSGEVRAALGLALLKQRLSDSNVTRLLAALRETAERIAYDSGYRHGRA